MTQLHTNVCFKKTGTKHSSNTLLHFVPVFLKQTLYQGERIPIFPVCVGGGRGEGANHAIKMSKSPIFEGSIVLFQFHHVNW